MSAGPGLPVRQIIDVNATEAEEKEVLDPISVPQGLMHNGVVASVTEDGSIVACVGRSVSVDVVQAHNRKQAFSSEKWLDGKHTFREVFEPAYETERVDVFGATGSFKWSTLKPIPMHRKEMKEKGAIECTLQYFNTLFNTKGVEGVAAGVRLERSICSLCDGEEDRRDSQRQVDCSQAV